MSRYFETMLDADQWFSFDDVPSSADEIEMLAYGENDTYEDWLLWYHEFLAMSPTEQTLWYEAAYG